MTAMFGNLHTLASNQFSASERNTMWNIESFVTHRLFLVNRTDVHFLTHVLVKAHLFSYDCIIHARLIGRPNQTSHRWK